ncbi:hypothetical protein [Catellatospora vulcania]|uniref:hypothetical protein n=1 Tax=Catellatospora vulcania TaxID=1460450 RepID=UPI0012D47259|nr:hypothetical protein [Catellatospora vulcania]
MNYRHPPAYVETRFAEIRQLFDEAAPELGNGVETGRTITGRHAKYLAARRHQVSGVLDQQFRWPANPWAGGPQVAQWCPDTAAAACRAIPAAAIRLCPRP